MELAETAPLMESDDYKDRFKAEYYQLRIRYEKLEKMIKSYEDGTLRFAPKCPIAILKMQEEQMKSYLLTLSTRAAIEDIEIKE